jgi:hypothetical protein
LIGSFRALFYVQRQNVNAGVFFAFLYSRENKNRSTVFRLESVESAVSSQKSVKYFKGSRKNNYLKGLIILAIYDTIDENKGGGE